MRKILTALAFGAATFTATPAIAEPLTNPAAQLEKLSIDNLSEILRELGAQQIEPSTSAAGKSVTFRDGNIPYHMILAGCDKAGGACIATVMLVVIDGGSATYPLDSFNSFNKDNSFVSAIKLEGTKFAVTRMIVTSGGISGRTWRSTSPTSPSRPTRSSSFSRHSWWPAMTMAVPRSSSARAWA